MSPRARPLPPDERRAQILRTAEPLVVQHGTRVTTRQIADAAGLAEGTLFRIFPTKDELVRAVIESAMDPTPVSDRIDAIDLGDPLRSRVAQVVWILHRQIERISPLMPVVRDLMSCGDEARHLELTRRQQERTEQVTRAIAEVLEPDAGRLRMGAAVTAQYLQAVAMAVGHPLMRPDAAPELIVATVLDGIVGEPGELSADPGRPGELAELTGVPDLVDPPDTADPSDRPLVAAGDRPGEWSR